MKPYHLFIFTGLLSLLIKTSSAQEINWKTLQPSQRHLINLNAGFEQGSVMAAGYGYHFNTRMPLVLNVEYSMPFGDRFFDDFKTRIGGQLNILRAGNFYSAVKAYGVIRRFENDFARMMNFGSELSATAGFYKKKWFAAGEFGFDKAITTHIKHSDLMKEYNPELQSGWYIPTGGNFFYGLQAGYSFKRFDVYAKAGGTIEQDLKTRGILPYYFRAGWNIKF